MNKFANLLISYSGHVIGFGFTLVIVGLVWAGYRFWKK